MKPTALIVLLLVLCLPILSLAQDTTPTVTPTIEFTGTVDGITATTITVGGLVVDITSLDPAFVAELTPGTFVNVSGTLENSIVIAISVELVAAQPTQTPEATQEPPDSSGGLQLNAFRVSYGGRVFDGTNTTFTYAVVGTGSRPDLSHFDVEIPLCTPELVVVSTSPASPVTFGVDPTTGIDGVKWDQPLQVTDSRAYSITFAGDVPEGSVLVAVKDGDGFTSGTLPGPACSEASIVVDKLVSADGITWVHADSAPGPEVELTGEVYFRFEVMNDGTVPLTGITLTDSLYDTTSCEFPAELQPDQTRVCEIGPFPVEAEQHTNTATVTALYETETVTDSDDANYYGGDLPDDMDDDDSVIIVIEGPVQSINANIITIFDIDIEIDASDPLLTVIQIGDEIRVEGDWVGGPNVTVIAINIVIIDVDIYVNDTGDVWRDAGNCGNPPPPWAPAHGWRARCEGGGFGSDRDSRRSSGRSSRRS